MRIQPMPAMSPPMSFDASAALTGAPHGDRASLEMPVAGLPVAHAIVVSDFAWCNGGAARVAIESALALARAGLRVTFIHGSAEVDESLKRSAVETVGLGLRSVWDMSPVQAARDGIWNAEVRRRLTTELSRIACDRTVVHLHQWTKTLSPSVLSALVQTGLRTVITAHDYFLFCPNGAYFDFPTLRPCTRQPMSVRCLASSCDSRSYPHKLVRIARQAKTRAALARFRDLEIIHVSEFALDTAKPFLPPGSRNFHLRNPITVERQDRVRAERNREFLFLGRLTAEKGCVVAATAARRAGVPIAFMGSGPMEGTIRAVNPEARLIPWAGPAEVDATLRTARCLVFPSLWYETSGLVVAEASARGIPTISARNAGTYWIGLEEDVSIVRVEPTVENIARAFIELQDDRRLEELSRACYRAYWRDPPSVDAHLQALLDIYAGRVAPAFVAP